MRLLVSRAFYSAGTEGRFAPTHYEYRIVELADTPDAVVCIPADEKIVAVLS